jgi:hypothetical protein
MMTTHAQGYYEIKSWDESNYEETEGQTKLARAATTQTFHGDIEGESTTQYLMAYLDDGTATSVGLTRITGQLGGRSGSFVVYQISIYHGAETGVNETWQIIPGSGTGELRGLKGSGTMRSNEERRATYTLDYEFE